MQSKYLGYIKTQEKLIDGWESTEDTIIKDMNHSVNPTEICVL